MYLIINNIFCVYRELDNKNFLLINEIYGCLYRESLRLGYVFFVIRDNISIVLCLINF